MNLKIGCVGYLTIYETSEILHDYRENVVLIQNKISPVKIFDCKFAKGILFQKSYMTSHHVMLAHELDIPFMIIEKLDYKIGDTISFTMLHNKIHSSDTIKEQFSLEVDIPSKIENKDVRYTASLPYYQRILREDQKKMICGEYFLSQITNNLGHCKNNLLDTCICFAESNHYNAKHSCYRISTPGDELENEFGLTHEEMEIIEVKFAIKMGFDIIFPLINDSSEYSKKISLCNKLGHKGKRGVMVEIPSLIQDFKNMKNVEFIYIGMGDLATRYFNVQRYEIDYLNEEQQCELNSYVKKFIESLRHSGIYITLPFILNPEHRREFSELRVDEFGVFSLKQFLIDTYTNRSVSKNA